MVPVSLFLCILCTFPTSSIEKVSPVRLPDLPSGQGRPSGPTASSSPSHPLCVVPPGSGSRPGQGLLGTGLCVHCLLVGAASDPLSTPQAQKALLVAEEPPCSTSESQKSKSLMPVLKFCCLLASFSFWLFSADFCTRNCHWSARAARRAWGRGAVRTGLSRRAAPRAHSENQQCLQEPLPWHFPQLPAPLALPRAAPSQRPRCRRRRPAR